MRLKDRTLKNVYERRERRTGLPLLEAVDMQKLTAASNAIAKLEGIVPDDAAMFNSALETAKNELQAYMNGGVKQAFKNIATDPVAKATSMASAIRAGFAALPKVLKLYLPKGSEKETQKSCLELVPAEKQQAFIQTMTKAFAPPTSGAISTLKSLFSGGGMPYVQNLSAAVQELLQNVAVDGVFRAGQQAAAQPAVEPTVAADPTAAATPPGATAPSTAGQAAPTPSPANATGTQPTQASAAATAAKGSAPTTATAAPTTAPTSATPKKIAVGDTAAIADLANYLTKKVGVDAPTLTKVLTQLAKEQKLVS